MSGLEFGSFRHACENIYCNSRLGGRRCNCTLHKFGHTSIPPASQSSIPAEESNASESDAAKSASCSSSSPADCTEAKCDPFLLAQLEQFPLEGVNMHEFLPRRHIVTRSEMLLAHWKMNLLAASADASSLFVASAHSILNIPLDSNGVPLTIAHDIYMNSAKQSGLSDTWADTEVESASGSEADAEPTSSASLSASDGTASSQSLPASVAIEEEKQAEAQRRHLDQFDRFQTSTIQTLHIPNSLPPEHNEQQSQPQSAHDTAEINCLRLLRFGTYDLLAAVTMNGVLALFDIQALHEAPVIRRCRRSDWDDHSAWSVAAFTPAPTGYNPFAHAHAIKPGSHSRSSSTASTASVGAPPSTTTNLPVPHTSTASLNRPVVVVGTNAHYAFLWTLDANEEEQRGKQEANHAAADLTQTESESSENNSAMISEPSANAPPGSSTNSPIITTSPPPVSVAPPPYVEGGHNIPSVNISSDGKFLAFACIDSLVHIVSMPSGNLHVAQVIDGQWGWGVRWIKRDRIRTLPFTLEALRQHEAHTPLPSSLQQLYPRSSRPARAPVGGGPALRILPPRDEEILNHMTEQFVLQLTGGVPLPAPQQQELRRAIRAQLIARFVERGVPLDQDEIARQEAEDEERDEDDDELNSDSEMDDEHEPSDENASDDAGGDDDDDMPGLLSDEEADEEIEVSASAVEAVAAGADAVDHHEMGWEAGFEPEDQAASSVASSAAHSEMEVESEAAVQVEDEPQSQPQSAARSQSGDEEHLNRGVSSTTQVESVPPTPTGAVSRAVSTADVDAPSPTATSPSSSISPAAPVPTSCSDLLVYTSKSHLHLLDHNLNKLDSMRFAVESTLTIHRSLDRLLFVEIIEELSLLLLASSASDRLLLYRIVKYACGSYRMQIVGALPANESCRVPIKGITVVKSPAQPNLNESSSSSSSSSRVSFPQFVERGSKVKSDGTTGTDASAEIPPSPTSCFSQLARSLASWRVYILYADETLVGIELSAAKAEPDFLEHSDEFFL